MDLLGSLSGIKSDEIGFEYILVGLNEARTQFYALVTYPKKGTDAYEKGINRGRFITAVDGKDITSSNYRSIFSGTGSKTLSMADFKYNSLSDSYNLTPASDIKIQMEKGFAEIPEKGFAEIPVYMDSVYTINNTKIGYMVYNFFATDRGDDSHDYDRLLMERLANIKAQGATEMVLDLRYNGGGRVSTAIALASALVKDRSIDNILVTAEYNNLVARSLEQEDGPDYNKDYFIDKIYKAIYDKDNNLIDKKFITDVPELNLSRLYVLVTGGSASASEFVINGLKPYMEVILIGETTYGKNVGSISIYEKNDPKNKWGMQPIIVKYNNSKGESEFTAGFEPDIDIDEFDALNLRLVDFGDTEDPLLGAALNEIAGSGAKTRSMGISKQIVTNPRMIEIENSNSIYIDKSRFEMIDDTRGDKIKELMNK